MTTPVITDLRGQITDLLSEVAAGGLADHVADALRARQIKGSPKDTCACPIAQLIKTLPGVEQVDVENCIAVVWVGDAEFVVELPLPVSNFVFLFDEGVFLDLVKRPAVAS